MTEFKKHQRVTTPHGPATVTTLPGYADRDGVYVNEADIGVDLDAPFGEVSAKGWIISADQVQPLEESATTTTPAAVFRLRDQLTLDLSAIASDPTDCLPMAEYLLSSGLISLDAMQARYDETHQDDDESDVKGDDAEPQTWARGEGIEVGATVEYAGNFGILTGSKGLVLAVGDGEAKVEWDEPRGFSKVHYRNLENLQRIA